MDAALSRFARDFMKGRQLEELEQLDIAAVREWSDAQLAGWQSGYPADSPQWLLAQAQWQVRLLDRQAQAAARQANKAAVIGGLVGGVIGVAGTLAGALLTWFLGK